MKRIVALLLIVALSLSLASCLKKEDGVIAPDKTPSTDERLDVGKITVTPVDLDYTSPETAMTALGVDLMKRLYKSGENIMVSPVSVSLALGLTAGGAKGETYDQFEKVLGRGVAMSEMNAFYQQLSERLDECESVDIDLANSVWMKKGDVDVERSFLEYADELYDAEVFSEPFDDNTVKKINSWVDDNTDGMIKEIIDRIGADTVMYLINAIAFDAKWQREYTDTSDYFTFTNYAGEKNKVTGMYSTEGKYLEDENTTGFVKNYKGGEYGFAVLLPDEDVDIDTYLDSLTGEKLAALFSGVETAHVETAIPKFTYEYSASLKEVLASMGLTDAFTYDADLTGIGTSPNGDLYVDNVLHKTFIEVAEEGTKAAAVTAVVVNTESAEMPHPDTKYVIADRPFVYAIIDNESGVPLFLGAVFDVE